MGYKFTGSIITREFDKRKRATYRIVAGFKAAMWPAVTASIG